MLKAGKDVSLLPCTITGKKGKRIVAGVLETNSGVSKEAMAACRLLRVSVSRQFMLSSAKLLLPLFSLQGQAINLISAP